MSLARIVCTAALVVFSGAVALADKKKIDNPEFTLWSKYKPDTMTKLKMTSEFNGMKSGSTVTTTLKEVGADKLVLEMEVISNVNGMEFKAPATKREVTKTIEVDDKIAEQIGKGAKPEGTVEEGTETVKVGKDDVKTKWYKFKNKTSGMEVEGQTWTSDDVPGSIVKLVSKGDKFSSTMELVEFVKK
jgi:hypothetical protein